MTQISDCCSFCIFETFAFALVLFPLHNQNTRKIEGGNKKKAHFKLYFDRNEVLSSNKPQLWKKRFDPAFSPLFFRSMS